MKPTDRAVHPVPSVEEIVETFGVTSEKAELLHREASEKYLTDQIHHHAQDEAVCWDYLRARLRGYQAQIVSLLGLYEDVGHLAAIVSDGTLTEGEQYVTVGTLRQIHELIQHDWPVEYEKIYLAGREKVQISDGKLIVLGLLGSACKIYVFPRAAILGEPH